jgi:trk system potassium uptake protein TrkH
MLHLWGAYVWLLQRNLNPSVVLVGSFVVLIVFGTVALKLPSSTPIEQPISWVDAAFTATSATCVTGLVVRDTGAGFTRFGEWVILGLIQLGGLGVILFGSLVALLMGSSLSLRAAHVIADTTRPGGANPASIRRLVVFAAIVVFGLEAIGAAALYVGWPGSAEWAGAPTGIDQTGDRIFASVFHSISAFCNAGFATTSDGLRSVRFHWTSHVVIAGLIVVGGIGLPVYANFASIIRWRLLRRRQRKTAPPRLSLHSKIVILATIALYLVGVVGLSAGAVLDRGGNLWQALLDGHFMSITARTAGFDTVAPVSIDPLGRLTLMVMMFIGGSPSSAAGGVKTVALVVLLLVAFRAAQGRDSTTIFKRQIPEEIIRKAAALFVLHLAVIGATLATLLVTESGEGGVGALPGGFERLLFESVSACSTVGLSMDATMGITDAGKWALICGMFIGRVGSLAFLVALVGLALKRRPRYDYATEAVTMS